MDRSNVATLISATYTKDLIGQPIPTYQERTVFCDIGSVSGSEWAEAGRNGIKAELRIVMNRYEYEGEKECAVDGIRYGIYRTYIGKGESIELYLERKAGVQNCPVIEPQPPINSPQ